MIGRAGGWSLGLGLVAAVAATLLWLRVALHGSPERLARRATWATLAAGAAGCGVLEWALLSHDFSVRYVADNGGRHVPLYFTITSLWSALDGSLLLWLLILTGYAALLARSGAARSGAVRLGTARSGTARAAAVHPWAMTVLSVVCVFFFALAYFAANPFHPVHPAPSDGPGPNPLLREHPAMGVHPPLLYAGYVGMVVPFAYAVAALLAGTGSTAGTAWLAAARRWALLAWTFLTAGIVLGAWWSYAVLGWGGYWAWDPVENASLLPWLTATAALHATLVPRRRLAGWVVTLYCATFLLVLVGTFLTRSGAVASVHSFTQSPLGPMLLGFVLLVAAAVSGLLIWRGGRFTAPGPPGPPLSREAAMLGNAVLLAVLASVVLIGTIFPLVSEELGGARAAVGPGYFNRTAVPVALVMLVLMGAAALVRPGGDRPAEVARRLAVPAVAGLGTIAVVGLASRPGLPALAAFGIAAFVLAGTVTAALDGTGPGTRAGVRAAIRRLGGLLAHAGVATAAIGVAASSAYTASAEREVSVGQAVTVRGVTARLTGIDRAAGDQGMAGTLRLTLLRHGAVIATARPQLRYYPTRDMTVSLPAIRSRPAGDVYVTVTQLASDGRTATVRLAVNPLVGLVWLGGAVTALGGLLALRRRPHRGPDRRPHRGPDRRPHRGPHRLLDRRTRRRMPAPGPVRAAAAATSGPAENAGRVPFRQAPWHAGGGA